MNLLSKYIFGNFLIFPLLLTQSCSDNNNSGLSDGYWVLWIFIFVIFNISAYLIIVRKARRKNGKDRKEK